ncbi:hypothetical protein Peur_017224 [Populus x canadensis]
MMMPVLPDGFGSGSFFFSAIFPFSCLFVAASSSGFFSGFCVRFFFPVAGVFLWFFVPKSPLVSPFQSPVFFSSFFFSLCSWLFSLASSVSLRRNRGMQVCSSFFASPVRIPSLAFIVGEWHPSPLAMKTQDCYCRSNEGMRIEQCPFLV